MERTLTQNKAFIGGAVNPRDADLKVSVSAQDTTKWLIDGKKTLSIGFKVSDVNILEGKTSDGASAFAIVPSKQPCVRYSDEWVDTLGMCATYSGGVVIDNVVIDADDALG